MYERERDLAPREKVLVERRENPFATILGIILAVAIVLAIVWFFFLGGLASAPTSNGLPDRVSTEQVQVGGEQP